VRRHVLGGQVEERLALIAQALLPRRDGGLAVRGDT
jgi:hypothetical protein